MAQSSADHYPWRWKFADAVEDLWLLHRAKFLSLLLLALLGIGVAGYFVFGDDSSSDVSVADGVIDAGENDTHDGGATDSSSEEGPIGSGADVSVTPTTSSSTTSTTTTPTSTTSTTTTTTTTIPEESPRAPESPDELAATQPGAVAELGVDSITLVGGLPSDAAADEILQLTSSIFDGFAVVDEQVVDGSFPPPSNLLFRLSAADLFGYNRNDVNDVYLPLLDRLAAAMIADDTWTVEVAGHSDSDGPAAGNQALSERRARDAADRLIAQGVDASRVTAVGRGEDEPIATNATEEGRLKNRRLEFTLSQ